MSSDTPSQQSPGSSSGYAGSKESLANASRDSLAEDVSSLREDMAKMQEILLRFAAEAREQAARTARNVGQTVASQFESTASGIANTGADLVSSATEQVKTVTNELEGVARRNPLGKLAIVVGIELPARLHFIYATDLNPDTKPWVIVRSPNSAKNQGVRFFGFLLLSRRRIHGDSCCDAKQEPNQDQSASSAGRLG